MCCRPLRHVCSHAWKDVAKLLRRCPITLYTVYVCTGGQAASKTPGCCEDPSRKAHHKNGMWPGPAGFLALALAGRDAFGNACSIEAAQVRVTCQPVNALQHVEVHADAAEGAVSIHANATSQGGCCAASCQTTGLDVIAICETS